MWPLKINNLKQHKGKAVLTVVFLAVAFGTIGILQVTGKSPTTVFQEARQWQIASDAPNGIEIYGTITDNCDCEELTIPHNSGEGSNRLLVVGVSIPICMPSSQTAVFPITAYSW